jgi:hypothetical protein
MPEMERGDLVRCLFPGIPGEYALTRGKIYEILSQQDGWLTLQNDLGFSARYAGVRFEMAATRIRRARRPAA